MNKIYRFNIFQKKISLLKQKKKLYENLSCPNNCTGPLLVISQIYLNILIDITSACTTSISDNYIGLSTVNLYWFVNCQLMVIKCKTSVDIAEVLAILKAMLSHYFGK